MESILIFGLHSIAIFQVLRILNAGIGELRPKGEIEFNSANLIATISSLSTLIILDRFYAFEEGGIATWRLIPTIVAAILLIGTKVFYMPENPKKLLRLIPQTIGIISLLICIYIIVN